MVILVLLTAFAAAISPGEDPENGQIALMMGLEEEDRGVGVSALISIEDAWAIEDQREEAQEPLVSRMYNGEAILGCDAQSLTFYCTLGLDNGNEWPQLQLTACGAEQLQVAWVDDYGYDLCGEAIAEGWRYELLAYTDTAYAYIGVVFTGLPIVTLHTDDQAGIVKETDTGVDVHIASWGDALYSRAQIHRRGGDGYVGVDKPSYRFEFLGIDLRGNLQSAARSVLGMEADTDWLLISNNSDVSAVRNHLCWQLWKEWEPDRQLAELDSRLVEVFLNDGYMGMYQLMQYVDPQEELEATGGNPQTDVCIRRIVTNNRGDRPREDRSQADYHEVELRYAPEGMTADEAFDVFDRYTQIELGWEEMDSEAFADLVLSCFDIDEVLSYYLFVQGYNLRDNVLNNLYIWALRQSDGTYRYAFSPWDMDRSLSVTSEEEKAENDDFCLHMQFVHRMLTLDVGGCRERLWAMWQEKRSGPLSDDALYQRIQETEDMVNASGAYLRESERWRGGAQKLNLAEMSANMIDIENWVEFMLRENWPVGDMQTQ